MKRVGFAALVLIALYILIWLARFVWGNYHKALEQRQLPPDARAPIMRLG
ncbi:MAG: hypothetical protein ACE149_12900 [Armatimonadota bacterium]